MDSARAAKIFFDGSRAFVTSRVLLPRGFLRGRRCRRRMRGGLGDRAPENGPHPHFVSPSPRKKTRGEGLSTGKMRWLRLCRAVSPWLKNFYRRQNPFELLGRLEEVVGVFRA